MVHDAQKNLRGERETSEEMRGRKTRQQVEQRENNGNAAASHARVEDTTVPITWSWIQTAVWLLWVFTIVESQGINYTLKDELVK